MSEIIISLDWEYLDDLLEYIDNKLTWCNFPTILRMRAQMVAEELFQALMRTEDAAQTRMRCTNPDQKTILLQYRSPQGPAKPDVHMIDTLVKAGVLYGIKVQFAEASCTLTVGEK